MGMTDWERFMDEKIRFLATNCHRVLDCGGGTPFQRYLAIPTEKISNSIFISLLFVKYTKKDEFLCIF